LQRTSERLRQRPAALASATSAPTVRKLALVVAVVAVAANVRAGDCVVDDVPEVALASTAVDALVGVAAFDSKVLVSIEVPTMASAAKPLSRMGFVGRVNMVWFFVAM
jgi:hypothetical protein